MTARLRATILGCGASPGVPHIGNFWGNCDPAEPKNRRTRCSLLLERFESGDRPTRVLVDTGPDMRAQLLALRVYAGPETAGQVGALWAALSRAAHHLDYEMAPSVTDLRRWRDQTAELARALELAPLAHQPFG